jgi:two-component system sensor histidine kinase KdpD
MTNGRLKIFLGYAAGVGKTYAMLEAACQRKTDGVDVAVALVETHGSSESETLLRHFAILPLRRVPDPDGESVSMDVDAVLARRPALALVDDLDRPNPQGARHPRRYQDVEELLAAGIDVYATLNILHLASLTDIIQQITGLVIADTVPDSLLDKASEIELVDLPPEELLARFREGKVHVPLSTRHTIELLYRKGNLTALRELAMRRAAERVDDQMRDYMQIKSIPGPWPAGERLLVCVSANPLSERLVRATRRLADDLNAPWYALHVETPDSDHTQLHREHVVHCLQLAESLGGQVVTLTGHDVASAVMEFAHKTNVTKVIVGKPLRPRWLDLLRGSLVDQIVRDSRSVDVYIISGESQPLQPVFVNRFRPHKPLLRYLGSFLLVAVAVLVGGLASSFLDPPSLVILYLVAVVIAAIYLGRGPSVLTSLLSLLAYELFFIIPRYGLSLRDLQYLLTFGGLLLVAWVISNMAAIARDQVGASQRREAHTAALSLFSRELTEALSREDVLRVILQRVSQTFSREVVVFLPENGSLRLQTSTVNLQLDVDELRVVHWAYEHGESAGRSTNTLPHARLRAIPLITSRGTIGVMGVMPPDAISYLDPDQRRLLGSFASLSALALERALLADQASQAQVLQAAERLQTALLNSISHDLRTPLSSITGVLSSLKEADLPGDDRVPLDHETQSELIDTALEEAMRLNRLVANLLNMTRLEAGALHLKCEPCDLQDLVGSTVSRLTDRLTGRPLHTRIAENLPLVNLDFVMMCQVLFNLLDNAIKYSPTGTPLEIEVTTHPQGALITIADEGLGIPPEDLERVFTKFYRVQRPDGVSGTGLGLSICRGIVEAHGGRIWAENRPTGGAIIKMILPTTMIPIHQEKTLTTEAQRH